MLIFQGVSCDTARCDKLNQADLSKSDNDMFLNELCMYAWLWKW